MPMHTSFSAEERPIRAKIAETEKDAAAVRKHLAEITEGAAFKGSHRSAQFLRYIVEQAIEGHLDSLKERVIGVELFGRSPTYDTSEDAIVRVTASDVRKRLLQHYGQYGATSGLRITLPLGSYVPAITHENRQSGNGTPAAGVEGSSHLPRTADGTELEPSEIAASVASEKVGHQSSRRGFWLIAALAILCAVGLFAGGLWIGRYNALTPNPLLASSPWWVFINSQRLTHIVFSDPAMVEVQVLTGHRISASDYANQQYLPDRNTMSPEVTRACNVILHDEISAAVDPPITVEIAALGQSLAKKLRVDSARDLRMPDLHTDDNFVFLGSPRSNPWTALLSDQLDFRFVFNKDARQEIIHNYHPRAHEMTEYLPTAMGGGTGESYAIVALVQNLDQNGQVLLLAGVDAEGTQAAGRFVTDLPRFTRALDQCGEPRPGALSHFEFLLRLNTMAGSPHNTDVVACHLLGEAAAH
ncbi:MAG: hypothetical protein WBX22_22305 [Silvibacterium sp.]